LRKEIEEEALREAYLRRGLSIEKCAKLFDSSTNKIWRLLRKYGIQTRRKGAFTKFSKIPEDALRRAYLEEKRTLQECGELFGASATVIRKALKFHGLPVRKGGPIKEKNYPKRRRKELPGLAELWEEGYGVRDIAFLLDARETLVRKRLKQLGLWKPKRKPTRFINWNERCTRCGILFDCELFSKTEEGVCASCEREIDARGRNFEENSKNLLEKDSLERDSLSFSPLQLLAMWKELLSGLSKEEAEKERKEWLDAIRKKLSQGERRLLKRIQKRLKIKGLGKVSTLELIAQLGILFEEFDYEGREGFSF